jgi:hypothetical protein
MAMHQQFREAVIREIIHEEILIEQRHELAALATLLLAKTREEEDSSNSVWKNLRQDPRRPSD